MLTRVTICNPAALPQTRWTTFATPLIEGEALVPMTCRGALAVPGRKLGVHSQLWHLRCDIGPGETLTLDDWKPSAWKDTPRAFPILDRDAAGLFKLVPTLMVRGGGTRSASCSKATVVDSSPMHQTWLLEVHAAGWHLKCWQTVWAWQDAIDMAGYVCWSDPTRPEWRTPSMVDISVYWGEMAALHGRVGVRCEGKELDLYGGYVADGVALPFRGILMPDTGGDEHRDALLAAASESPIYAAGMFPTGTWLALGARPNVAAVNRARIDGWLATPGTLLDARPGASALVTGTTGSQECFGATKGVAAAGGDPWALRELMIAADDGLLRCGHHLELDGTPVTKENHPKWETWSLATERNAGDRLGKSQTQPWGWDKMGERQVGIDDQHRGDLPEIAAYALTGDLMLLDDLSLRFNADEARAKGWRAGVDAPRSLRTFQSLANLALLVDEPLRERILVCSRKELGKRFEAWIPGNPVRPLETVRDDRVLPGLDAWVGWNNALAVLAAESQAAAWGRLGRLDDHLDWDDFSTMLANTIVDYATFRSLDGQWLLGTGVQWFENGAAPPEGYYVFPRVGASFSPAPGTNLLVGSGGWHEWAAAAYVVAANSGNAKAQQLVSDLRPGPGSSTAALEWWAVESKGAT